MAGLGGLGALAGGIAKGFGDGLNWRKQQMELQQLQQAQSALKARQKALLAQLSGDTSMPGGVGGGSPMSPPPAGAQPASPQLSGPPPAAAPGGGGAPPMAAQLQTLGGGSGPQPQSGQSQPQGQPSAAPGVQTPPSQPNAATQAPGGASAAPGGDSGLPPGFNVQQVAQTYQQLKKLALDDYRSVAKEIHDSNPGKKWKPTEFINAVDAEFKQRSQLEPDLKEAVLAESAAARAQANYMQSQVREHQSQERIDQGDERLHDAEQKNAWYEHYQDANAAERAKMDKWRQSHGEEEQHDLEAYRAAEVKLGQGRLDVSQENAETHKAVVAAAGGAGGNAKIARTLNGNPVGKNYLLAHTFKTQIDSLADDPETAKNPAAQLDLIDSAVRQASGGVARKAQFDAIAKRNGFTDFVAMHSYLADGRGMIGPKIIADIKHASDEQAEAAMAAGRQMFPQETAQLEGKGDSSADKGGGSAPVPGARKAPDGNWYVSDPNRPGKYLKVVG